MKRLIILTFMALLIIGGAGITYSRTEDYRLQREIAESLIRFHVRANSDTDEDQALKLKVKDAVVEFLSGELSQADSVIAARDIIARNVEEIKRIADTVIAKEGYAYGVNAYFERSYFPLKQYGDMSFPPGEYEAFRVDIGEAVGHNWWCVLFPPLCFVDSACAVVPDDTKEDFQNRLSPKAYDAITGDYEVRFKYLTFLNKFVD